MILTPKAVESRISGVAAPGLVVMGTRDPDFKDPAAEAHRPGDQLQAGVRLIEGAGHYPHVERLSQAVVGRSKAVMASFHLNGDDAIHAIRGLRSTGDQRSNARLT